MKILLLDIETAPIVAHVWQMSLWKTNIHADQVLSDTTILSFAAKWLNKKDIIYKDQSKEKDVKNDKNLLLKLKELLDDAEIVVVQNGAAFDVPTIKARMLAQGINPPSPFRVVDTFLIAKKMFNFSYNSLDFLGKILKCKNHKDDHKKFPGMKLWQECLLGNQSAWREMKKYNIIDVVVLEEIYLKMRPWIDGHPNMGIYVDSDKPVCPKCRSANIIKENYAYTMTGIYQRYICKDCGGWSRGRQKINDTPRCKQHYKQQLSN